MSVWFEKGRPAIFEAVQAACEQIDREFQLASNEDAREAEAGRIKVQLATIDALRKENSRLRALADALLSTASPATGISKDKLADETPARPPLTSPELVLRSEAPELERPKPETEWRTLFIKVGAKFNALSENFKQARLALQKRKDERDKWMHHAVLLERRIKSAEKKHGIQILENETRCNTREPNLALAPASRSSTINSGVMSDDSKTGQNVVSCVVADHHPYENAVLGPPIPVQSDTTYSDPEDDLPQPQVDSCPEPVLVKCEPSSDGPIIVSERVLKRRKIEKPAKSDQARVKLEDTLNSSSPTMTRQCVGPSQESIDLGVAVSHAETPRKRKGVEQPHQSTPAQENHTMAKLATDPLRENHRPQPQTSHQCSSALLPLDVNQRSTRPAVLSPEKITTKKGLGRSIGALAEDGFSPKTPKAPEPVARLGAGPACSGRLDSLLNKPCSSDEAPMSLSRSERPKAPRRALPVPQRRELPFLNSTRRDDRETIARRITTPTSGTSHPATATRQSAGHWRAAKQPSELRNKHVSELRLDDFKINPRANNGHDFAYSEVVRDKVSRQCLPGCTDMHCCGRDFRKLAESDRPKSPLTGAQRQGEQKLLEEYLGDHAYRLAAMSKEERKELWVEARTQQLANRFGRHRHRFSRMQSPPGFWNADFPSTQELGAERAEAAKREREAVDKRHREALRPNGIWMFRDE